MVDWTMKPPPKSAHSPFNTSSSSTPSSTLPKGVERRANNYNSNAGWTIGYELPKSPNKLPEKSGPK